MRVLICRPFDDFTWLGEFLDGERLSSRNAKRTWASPKRMNSIPKSCRPYGAIMKGWPDGFGNHKVMAHTYKAKCICVDARPQGTTCDLVPTPLVLHKRSGRWSRSRELLEMTERDTRPCSRPLCIGFSRGLDFAYCRDWMRVN